MNQIKKIGLFLCSLFLLVACGSEKEAEENVGGIIYPFQSISELYSFTLRTKSEEYLLESDGQEWVSNDLKEVDQKSVATFLEKVVSLQGKVVDERDIDLQEKAVLELILSPGPDEFLHFSIYHDAEGNFYGKNSTDSQWLELLNIPIELEEFSIVYLQPSIDFQIENIEELVYEDPVNKFRLNQVSDFSKVETAPFVSGWYLHDIFQTAFSVEYKEMESILSRLANFKGMKKEGVTMPSQEELYFQLTIIGDGKSETLSFGEPTDTAFPVYLKEAQQAFEVPLLLAKTFQVMPFEVIDNFISIIPLDSLTSAEVSTKDFSYLIEAEHELTTDENGKAIITSEFYGNGELLDESLFRKDYQYLAALKYHRIYEKTDSLDKSPEITIKYTFQSEGEERQHELKFYSINEEEYLVEKNGIQEFTAKKEQLSTVLKIFEENKTS